jgi:predicted dehydrogenase
MGVQGTKRRTIIGSESCITIDPIQGDADHSHIELVPLSNFDVAYVCVPDVAKLGVVDYLVSHGKHVLVEKPFSLSPLEYDEMQDMQNQSGSTVYVAYNHRFEPHIAAAEQILKSDELGEIYTVSLSYGNGTAQLVRSSEWRDTGLGVISDLGSHLLDMIDFWWGLDSRAITFVEAQGIENRAPDYSMFRLNGSPSIWCETTLLSWRNAFRCDIHASNGSLHISSLCKWGPTSLTVRNRVRPSGRPQERVTTLVQPDPTWQSEHDYFLRLIDAGKSGNISTSKNITRLLHNVNTFLSDKDK